ncbi:hypothetical protein E2320_013739 [Naja naja]|nr:hypothetical protein E2320_013739 [Naja naja]
MAKALSFSGVCCLLALLLGQPSLGHQQPWPFSEPNDFFGLWNKMKDDAIIYQATIMYHQAVGHLNKEHNCTYISAPEEKVHVQLMSMHGKIYHFRTVLVKVTCPPGEKRPNHKNCQIVPGSPKYLCFLELATFPAFNIHKVRVKSCEEYRATPSPPVVTPEEESEKEEGTPYM